MNAHITYGDGLLTLFGCRIPVIIIMVQILCHPILCTGQVSYILVIHIPFFIKTTKMIMAMTLNINTTTASTLPRIMYTPPLAPDAVGISLMA